MGKFSRYDNKKARELFQLRRFKDCFSEISNSEVSILDNEPPDGIIQFGDKKISVELTQVFWDKDKDGMDKKTQESIADMIMDLAEEKYSKIDSMPFVQLNVSFTDKYGLTKNGESLQLHSGDKKSLPDYIIEKVIEYLPSSEKQMVKVPEFDENWQRILHPKIQDIFITRHPLLVRNCWSADGGGAVPPISKDKIEKIVSEKNKRLNFYKSSFDECWLLIVEDSVGIAGYFDFRDVEKLLLCEFESDFHRAFILRNGKMEVFELRLLKRNSER